MQTDETQQPNGEESDRAKLAAVDAQSENTQPAEVKTATASGKIQKEKKTAWQHIQYWVLLNIGTLCVAAGVRFFKATNHFATGGVSGIAILLADWLSKYSASIFTQSNIAMVINILLLLVGFAFLGKKVILKTAYCSLVYSAENMLFEYLFPANKPPFLPELGTLTNQPFMELVYAMLLTGIGSAIIFNCKASSGGTDIIALIIKKFTNLDTGKALLVTDFAIACCSFKFGAETGLYSLLGLFAKAFIIDGVIENIVKSKYITIITSAPELVSDYILVKMKRDFTSYKATGGYTGNDKTIMITVCKRMEAIRLKAKVKEVDPSAFVIITDANEILGKGFSTE